MPDPTTATSALSLRSRAGAAATVTSIHSDRVRSCATFMVASRGFAFTGSPPMAGRVPTMRGAAARLRAPEALAQRVHQVDHVVGLLGRRGGLDLLAGGLALHELAQRDLVFILELARVEMRRLGVEDMPGQCEHVLRYSRRGDVLEKLLLVAHLIIIAQGRRQDSLAERLERDEVLRSEEQKS